MLSPLPSYDTFLCQSVLFPGSGSPGAAALSPEAAKSKRNPRVGVLVHVNASTRASTRHNTNVNSRNEPTVACEHIRCARPSRVFETNEWRTVCVRRPRRGRRPAQCSSSHPTSERTGHFNAITGHAHIGEKHACKCTHERVEPACAVHQSNVAGLGWHCTHPLKANLFAPAANPIFLVGLQRHKELQSPSI